MYTVQGEFIINNEQINDNLIQDEFINNGLKTKRKNNNPIQTFRLNPTELKLQTDIKELLKNNTFIRPHGYGHSDYFDNAFYVAENTINLQKYTTIPNVVNNILTSSAGHTLGYLRDFLKPYGLRFLGTPESQYITLGGAVVVGAHNGSKLQTSMSDYVVDMLVFDGNGDVKYINDPKLFINYGMLGIVFRISIKCFPAKNIYWRRIMHNSIDDVRITPYTHSLVFGPYSGKILEAQNYPTEMQPYKSIIRYLWELIPFLASFKLVSNMLRGMFYLFPALGLIISEYFLLEPNVIRDKFDYFEPAPRTKVYTLEYGIDASYLKNVYTDIMNLIATYRNVGTYVSYRFWVRFMPASNSPNSLSFNKDSAIFELTFSKDQPNAKSFATDIDRIFRSYGGRPHMGKTLINQNVFSNYDFNNLKKEITKYDPNKVYQNKFMRDVFII